jgi:large subunit ribosomal protein L30
MAPNTSEQPAGGKTLHITLRKSAIGYTERQKRTLKALGLRRIGQTVEHPDNAAVRGMVQKVIHLIEVS